MDQPQEDLHNNPPPNPTPEPTPKPHPKPKTTAEKKKCNLCQKSLKGKEGLVLHQKSIHGKVAKVNCGVCKKLFISGPDLADHKKNWQRECFP